MLNSFTNALHATALGTYTYLVYRGYTGGNPHFNVWILSSFFLVFVAKILGMIVHLPIVDHVRTRHNFFWILISIVVVIMNIVTLAAVHAPLPALFVGSATTIVFCALYVRTLFTATGHFYLVALALIIEYLICALLTQGRLRIAWLCILFSNVLWIVLSKSKFLLKNKFHNDIYHFALIGSSYLLYSTVDTGLWQAGAPD